MGNLFEKLKCTLDSTEESTSGLEDSSLQMIQNKYKERKNRDYEAKNIWRGGSQQHFKTSKSYQFTDQRVQKNPKQDTTNKMTHSTSESNDSKPKMIATNDSTTMIAAFSSETIEKIIEYYF